MKIQYSDALKNKNPALLHSLDGFSAHDLLESHLVDGHNICSDLRHMFEIEKQHGDDKKKFTEAGAIYKEICALETAQKAQATPEPT